MLANCKKKWIVLAPWLALLSFPLKAEAPAELEEEEEAEELDGGDDHREEGARSPSKLLFS